MTTADAGKKRFGRRAKERVECVTVCVCVYSKDQLS